MIEVKPRLQHQSTCPNCESALQPDELIWQGMHTCVRSHCRQCSAEIIEDLRVGHAVVYPCQIDLAANRSFMSDESSQSWLGQPLLESFKNPTLDHIEINKEILKESTQVIILNCVDFLYGHSLLKLLNAVRHLKREPEFGLVVIVQKFLRWMVPDGVAEVWTVDLPLRRGQSYYTQFNDFVLNEMKRFDQVYISEAHSHPNEFDIEQFTRIPTHQFSDEFFRVTFIWREDRLWTNFLLFRILRKLKMQDVALLLQNLKVRRVLRDIKNSQPSAIVTVAGLGRKTKFPDWVEDVRVERFNEATERMTCKIYSESRLVIGVHGSNMLLPSGHAGMTLDLMPDDRLGNICQDVLYQESDSRLATFRYRYLPIQISAKQIVDIANSMLGKYSSFVTEMIHRL